ncbi:MAG: histone [Chlamydiales bacterium]|nr:histone [Chlamydiales bacterium]
MALKDTCKTMRSLLECIQADLDKAEAGNKAAAQRVRTCTIKLEKASKLYRKESVKAEKSGGGKKRAGGKKAASKKAPAKKTPAKKAVKKKAAPKKKAVAPKKASKRATAKLPKKRKK